MENQETADSRWSARKAIRLDVALYYRDKEFTHCSTRDVGLGGMFVEFDRLSFPRQSMVELVVNLESGNDTLQHRFKANIAHIAPDGFGVAFHDFKITDFRVLQDLLQLATSVEPVT